MTRRRSSGGGPAAGPPKPAGASAGEVGDHGMESLRGRIDAIDRQLVRLLNERAGHAIALGRIKKSRGLPIYQPSREEEVLSQVQGCNTGPLENAALRRLFERIIDESRRIERTGTSGPPGDPESEPPR